MNSGPSRLRRAITLLVALGLVSTLYLLSQLPTLSSTEAEAIAARFRFEKLPFPETAGFTHKTVRQVHPSLAHLSAYLSAVGASVALGDIDGDGLPNDLCYVDPRIDQVVVAPAPGTPQVLRCPPASARPARLAGYRCRRVGPPLRPQRSAPRPPQRSAPRPRGSGARAWASKPLHRVDQRPCCGEYQ